jgi:IS30 family transposase
MVKLTCFALGLVFGEARRRTHGGLPSCPWKGQSGVQAQGRACRRPARSRCNKAPETPTLLAEVRELLATGATPRQIEAASARRHPDDPLRRVSHETLYDFIHVPAKGSVKKERIGYLRRKRRRRSPAPRAKGIRSG